MKYVYILGIVLFLKNNFCLNISMFNFSENFRCSKKLHKTCYLCFSLGQHRIATTQEEPGK